MLMCQLLLCKSVVVDSVFRDLLCARSACASPLFFSPNKCNHWVCMASLAGSGLVGLHMHAEAGYGQMGSSVNVYDLR
jgi:hypothetical protein